MIFCIFGEEGGFEVHIPAASCFIAIYLMLLYCFNLYTAKIENYLY